MRASPGVKKILGLGVVLAGGLLFSSPPETVDEILSRLEKKYNATETVSCRFSQTKTISQLEGIGRLEGRLYFKRPHFFRVEFRGPEKFTIYCNGKKIWLEDLDLDEVEVYDFSELGANDRLSRLLPPVFAADFEELKRAFTARLVSKEGGADRLELVPKPGSAYSFRNLRFDVDSLSRIPWMKIVYANGDTTEMKFRGWRSQPEISDSFFEYLKSPATCQNP
jgi:outer membrane lipoprotein-sorting protein